MDTDASDTRPIISPAWASWTHKRIGRCASPPLWGCFELNVSESDSDNDQASSEDEETVSIIVTPVDPANIPLPSSPPLQSIDMPSKDTENEQTEPTLSEPISIPVDPQQQLAINVQDSNLTENAPLLNESSLSIDAALENVKSHESAVLGTTPQLNLGLAESLEISITNMSQQTTMESSRDSTELPIDPAIIPDPQPTSANDEMMVINTDALPFTGDSPIEQQENGSLTPDEVCSTDCVRPTKLDKGKGREIIVDLPPSPVSLDTSAPEGILVNSGSITLPTGESVVLSPVLPNDASIVTGSGIVIVDAEQPQYTPPTPSSRQRRRRVRERRPKEPKYQPILTLRSSQGWLWNQDLFVPHYMKDRYLPMFPDPMYNPEAPQTLYQLYNSQPQDSQNPGIEYDCFTVSLEAGDFEGILPP